jgi:4-amino-4-deoxy-L-arabinose transferase-like glycosyltransferase
VVTALGYRVFGISEFWARLPSALSGIALVALIYLTGKFVHGKLVGFFAAAILLTCYHFLSFSRFGTMEVMLTLLTYLAVYAYLRLRDGSQKWWYLVWSAYALTLMVKEAGGSIAPLAIILSLAVDGRFKTAMRPRDFWQACLLALLIVAPWHVLMYMWYGKSFTAEYLGYHAIARATRTLEGNPSSYFYYVGKLVDGFFPWCLVAPFAIVSFIRKKTEGSNRLMGSFVSHRAGFWTVHSHSDSTAPVHRPSVPGFSPYHLAVPG